MCLKHCWYHLYADDTQIYYSFERTHLVSTTGYVNYEVNSIVNYCKLHSLSLNINKTSVILFGIKLDVDSVCDDLLIDVDCVLLPISKCAKILGVIVDSNL